MDTPSKTPEQIAMDNLSAPLFIFEASLSYDEPTEGTIRFLAHNQEEAMEILEKNLPPLPNRKILSVICIGPEHTDDTPQTLN